MPISSESNSSATPSPRWAEPCSSATNSSKKGTQRPSFRPLSALKPSRRCAGTFWLVTTALPNAASVAANITPSIAASKYDRAGNSSVASSVPRTILIGRPKPSMRPGMRQLRRSTFRSALAASTKRNNAKVISIKALPLKPSPVGLNQSKPRGPSSTPTATNTIGPDSDRRSIRSDIKL